MRKKSRNARHTKSELGRRTPDTAVQTDTLTLCLSTLWDGHISKDKNKYKEVSLELCKHLPNKQPNQQVQGLKSTQNVCVAF